MTPIGDLGPVSGKDCQCPGLTAICRVVDHVHVPLHGYRCTIVERQRSCNEQARVQHGGQHGIRHQNDKEAARRASVKPVGIRARSLEVGNSM